MTTNVVLLSLSQVAYCACANAIDESGDDMEDKLDALDSQFFAYPNDLTELLFVFVAKHSGEFGALSEPVNGG